jgi:hypothetical protein
MHSCRSLGLCRKPSKQLEIVHNPVFSIQEVCVFFVFMCSAALVHTGILRRLWANHLKSVMIPQQYYSLSQSLEKRNRVFKTEPRHAKEPHHPLSNQTAPWPPTIDNLNGAV